MPTSAPLKISNFCLWSGEGVAITELQRVIAPKNDFAIDSFMPKKPYCRHQTCPYWTNFGFLIFRIGHNYPRTETWPLQLVLAQEPWGLFWSLMGPRRRVSCKKNSGYNLFPRSYPISSNSTELHSFNISCQASVFFCTLISVPMVHLRTSSGG